MGSHAVNAGLHNSTGVKTQHGKSLFDDVPIAACSEPFILEFLFQSLHFHACNALGPHKGIGHDYAGEFIDCEKALLDVRGGFHIIVADAPAMGNDGIDIFLIYAFRFQKFPDMVAVFIGIFS